LGKAQIKGVDSLKVDVEKAIFTFEEQKPVSYYYLQLRTGLMSGFQYVVKDTVNITVGVPIEVNFRYYPKNYMTRFFDVELGYCYLVVNENVLTQSWLFKVGFGTISGNYNYNVQFHVGYWRMMGLDDHPDLQQYKSMLVLGYNFETASIPITIDYATSGFNIKSSLILIGIKIPVFNMALNEKQVD